MINSFIEKLDRGGQQLLGKNLWLFIKLIIRHLIAFLVVFAAIKLIKLLLGKEPSSYPLVFIFQFGEWIIGILFVIWTIWDIIEQIMLSIQERVKSKRKHRRVKKNSEKE